MVLKFIIGIIITIIISYLLGSINFSIVIGKIFKGQDIRTLGSKNAGLTNTIRCFGKRIGALVCVGDLTKGVVAVLLSRTLFAYMEIGLDGFNIINYTVYDSIAPHTVPSESIVFLGYIAGFFAILGHIFPIYYGFKGGKGVLTAASILLVIDIRTFAIIIPFFLIVSFSTRYVSVGSIAAAVFYPVLTFLVQYYWRDFKFETALLDTLLVICTSILLIYMHKSNMVRLKNKTENKIKFRKKNNG